MGAAMGQSEACCTKREGHSTGREVDTSFQEHRVHELNARIRHLHEELAVLQREGSTGHACQHHLLTSMASKTDGEAVFSSTTPQSGETPWSARAEADRREGYMLDKYSPDLAAEDTDGSPGFTEVYSLSDDEAGDTVVFSMHEPWTDRSDILQTSARPPVNRRLFHH
eukprot:TRINITY_DN10104_c0_g1_i2.p1 TRINITY_DN10104_c0_g1~~TRINITY_DN10104_c0_g1_i2.p1  ORF type:complete len:168 (-),score=32.26 TRINITY_DN10104_c0_g1_i2:391-894(-)